MGGVVEYIGAGGVDWDSAGVCGSIGFVALPFSYDFFASGLFTYPACNCSVSKWRF
jgi:hypothetical protein